MARILAVDWDRHEARCVLASVTREKMQILVAASAPLVDISEGGGDSRPDIGGSLRAALADQRGSRGATVVGVNRASVELLNFLLPPAKDAELPYLVQNQAARESNTLDDNAAIDFVPMNDNPEEPRAIMAAILSGVQRKRIHEACEGAGLKPTRIVLRPLAAASLFAQSAAPLERVCLLVNFVADEVDLTVMVDGRVAFLRTVQLPEGVNGKVAAQRLCSEVTRTIVVAQQGPLGGSPVERVFVYSGAEEHQFLIDQLNAELSQQVTALDPFEAVDSSEISLPDHPGRFASLLGMIADEVKGSHAIDFLHPRRPPRPPNRRRHFIFAATAVAIIGIAGGYMYWDMLNTLDGENQIAEQTLADFKKKVKNQGNASQLVEAIQSWEDGEIVWLDELRDLSRKFPASRDAIVQRMSCSPGRGVAGNIEITGLARSPSVTGQIEQNLTDDYRIVRTKRVGPQGQARDFAWTFESSIAVEPRGKEFYRDPQDVQSDAKQVPGDAQEAAP